MGHRDPRTILQTFIEPPRPGNVDASFKILMALGAIDGSEQLTTLGKYLAQLPCEPRVGKMIMMGAVLHCLDPVLTIAACAETKPFIAKKELARMVRQRRIAFSMNSQSDHVANVNAYNSVVANGNYSAFCDSNFINCSAIRQISQYKMQFRDILSNSGLLNINGQNSSVHAHQRMRSASTTNDALFVDDSEFSRDAHDVALVKACICAGLFPQVALVDASVFEKRSKSLLLRTRDNSTLSPSRDSACRGILRPSRYSHNQKVGSHNHSPIQTTGVSPSACFVYEEIFRVRDSRREFLTTVSSVGLWSILLFGAGTGLMEYHPVIGICVVDNWLMLRTSEETFNAILDLRSSVNDAVWKKFQNPSDRRETAL